MREREATMARAVPGSSREAEDIPAGYKRTEVGVIPEDWETVPIGCLADVVRGASPRPIDSPVWFDERSEVGWLRISDVTAAGKYLMNTLQNLSSAGVSNSRLVKSGSVVMSICATVGRPIITRKSVCIHDGFVVFEGLQAEQDYFYYVLADLEANWTKYGQIGSQMNLNTELVNSTPIPLPPPPEQRAIAEALSDVDGLLQALNALIAKKQAAKQAAMQQLLTGKARLPGFVGEWETKRLGEFASIRNQKILPSDVLGDTACVDLDHIGQGDGRLLGYSAARDSTSTKYRFFAGDVLLGRLRSYLRKYWHANQDGICTTEIWPLMVDARQADSGFLYAVVQSDRFIGTASVSYGTHMPRSDWDVVKNFEVALPPLLEQRAIAIVLSDMDAEIAALEQRRDKTRMMKQGMMQQLLTGRVRLVRTGAGSTRGMPRNPRRKRDLTGKVHPGTAIPRSGREAS